VQIKETLHEFEKHLIHYHIDINVVDKKLMQFLKEHNERSSRIHVLIDNKKVIDSIAQREIAHKQGRIKSRIIQSIKNLKD
jgi:hypothetical protein